MDGISNQTHCLRITVRVAAKLSPGNPNAISLLRVQLYTHV